MASHQELADKYKVTLANVDNFRKIFDEIDENDDKSLDEDELIKAMHKLGHTMNPRAIKAVIKACDKNGDGAIEFDEFCAIVASRIKHKDKKDTIKAMFDDFDADSDGFIVPQELHDAWTKMGDSISMEEAEAIVAEADENGDGKVSLAEFTKMWKGL